MIVGGSGIVPSLTRLTSRRGFRNFHEFSRFHVVDIAVYRNVIGNQRVVSDTHDILDDALRIVGECQPIDVVTFRRPRPVARVAPPTLVQGRGLQAARQEIAHVVVCEQQHSTIRVVNHKPFAGAEELGRDHQ